MSDADVNFDGTVDADDLEQQVLEDAINGVSRFNDGTHDVTMMPLKDRIAVLDRQRREEAADSHTAFGLRFTRLMSPGGWS